MHDVNSWMLNVSEWERKREFLWLKNFQAKFADEVIVTLYLLTLSHENGPAMNLVLFVYKQSHVVQKGQRRKGRVYKTEKKNCI